jgi:Tol biopolymer transport system component
VPVPEGAGSQSDVVAPTPDDPPRSLPALSDNAFSPSFAAGGRELLFHSGRERAVLMRAALDARGVVSRATPLARMSGADYHVIPSPDGRRLAFDSDREGVRGVYVARADGSDAHRISGEGYAAIPTWSPDGSQIAFVRAEPEEPRVWNIWLASLSDGALRRFTQHRHGQPWGASWFPGGQRVAYSLEDGLVIAGLRDGTSMTIPSPRPGRLVRTPAVSPDGTHVIFQVFGDGVWLLDVRTLNLRRVLDEPTAEEFAWAPDGRRVAFHAQRNGAWSLWQTAVDPARAAASPPTPLLPG